MGVFTPSMGALTLTGYTPIPVSNPVSKKKKKTSGVHVIPLHVAAGTDAEAERVRARSQTMQAASSQPQPVQR